MDAKYSKGSKDINKTWNSDQAVCSRNNYYTLIIFVFLSSINLLNENAKCIMPLLLLYDY